MDSVVENAESETMILNYESAKLISDLGGANPVGLFGLGRVSRLSPNRKSILES